MKAGLFFSVISESIFNTMSAEIMQAAADVVDNALKRKAEEAETEPSKAAKTSETAVPPATGVADYEAVPKAAAAAPIKGRENRLEQNRKAARESRSRKKVMIEELQRSVIFFSRANGALKQQNDELTRHLMEAQMHLAQHNKEQEAKKQEKEEVKAAEEAAAVTAKETKAENSEAAAAGTTAETQQQTTASEEQKKADTVATQAIFESQGFPAAAARAAAQAVNGNMDAAAAAAAVAGANGASAAGLPAMQPGATMQAMANFQQAAAAAMQQAMGQMKGVPGLTQMAATPVGSNPQHAFTDGT